MGYRRSLGRGFASHHTVVILSKRSAPKDPFLLAVLLNRTAFADRLRILRLRPYRGFAQNDTEGIYSYRKRKPANCVIFPCKMEKKAVYSTMVNLEKRGFSYVYS